MALEVYRKKRDFKRTPEPRGARARRRVSGLQFVIQKHAATHLHYDFRLELDGVLLSWAVPKGPSLDPKQRRLAVHVEDHPLDYAGFEGTIPKGEYGGGSVLLWDRGEWIPRKDPREGLRKGHLVFDLEGEKLRGGWALLRMGGSKEPEGKNWLLVKEKDDEARSGRGAEITERAPESVSSGLRIEDIGSKPGSVWHSNRASERKPARRGSSAARPLLDASGLPGARRATLPRRIAPQLATLVARIPEGDAWLHEIKYDGFRTLCEIARGKVRLLTRNGLDWTDRFGSVAAAAASLPVTGAILDGEIAVLRADGTTSFQDLQNVLRRGDEGLVYFVFDLLFVDGLDLRGVPIEQRKEALRTLLRSSSGSRSTIRYSDHLAGQGSGFFREACERGLEGVVSKRADGRYVSGRTGEWVKTKCSARQEFVIGGFTDPKGARSGLGSLLLGANENGQGLRYCGRVGTGFTQDLLRTLRRRLGSMETSAAPFTNPPRLKAAHWVKPKLVAEVSFSSWTDDGMLRHPSFEGIREDKPANEVVIEKPRVTKPPSGAGKRTAPKKPRRRGPRVPPKPPRRPPPVREPERKTPVREPPAEDPPRAPIREPPEEGKERRARAVTLTHPEKVLYPERGITKLDLVRYFTNVSKLMLPHLAERPLMLRRCPNGQGRECFFQKHPGVNTPPGLHPVRVHEAKGLSTYWTVDDGNGLVALVQMGVLEIHVWSSRADREEEPDRIVFDLDPDPSIDWTETAGVARRVREVLQEYDLDSYVKTTGGKGLHVLAPIRRGPGWDEVKAFAGAIASRLVRERPDLLTTHLAKAKRGRRIFVDVLRNVRGATWVAPYSPRARSSAPVSAPLRWSELPRLTPDELTVETMPARIRRISDPWAGLIAARQTLTAGMLREARRGAMQGSDSL